MNPSTRISIAKEFDDGVLLYVESKNFQPQTIQQNEQKVEKVEKVQVNQKCTHGPNGRCLNCPEIEKKDANKTENQKRSNCLHGPNGKCLNCIANNESKEDDKKQLIGKCNHGPNGKCMNCINDTPKTDKNEEKYLSTGNEQKKCQHGPNGRCLNCAIKDTSEAKHLSFDEFVDRNFAKCRSHSKNAKCQNCFIDLAVDYKIKLNCKNHEPYPKGMCSQCIPPSINVKRQEYRHVDYVQFVNFSEISRFIKNWMETGFQRVGILYGYFAEDPVYEKGVRAIVEILYEPPQENKYNESILLPDPFSGQIDKIIEGLGFERIGFVFTTFSKTTFLTNEEMIRAARFQEEFSIQHPIGMNVSKQVTLVLRGMIISGS